jgi:3-hydroxyacyl-CoA dehydrogenase
VVGFHWVNLPQLIPLVEVVYPELSAAQKPPQIVQESVEKGYAPNIERFSVARSRRTL